MWRSSSSVPWAPVLGQSTPVLSVRPPVAVARRSKEPGWTKTNNKVVRPDSLLDGLILVWGERVLEK